MNNMEFPSKGDLTPSVERARERKRKTRLYSDKILWAIQTFKPNKVARTDKIIPAELQLNVSWLLGWKLFLKPMIGLGIDPKS